MTNLAWWLLRVCAFVVGFVGMDYYIQKKKRH